MEDLQFKIITEPFEGPFDLLLFFIERDELDIQDIPISKITDDYLQYMESIEELNIDLASEFILVAAKLMRIKAKLLLPRKELNEAGEEIDPREELVQKLLEYKRFKEVIPAFQELSLERSKLQERGSATQNMRAIAQKALVDLELESLNLFKLLKTYQRLLEDLESGNRQVHEIAVNPYTVETQQKYLLGKLKVNVKSGFQEIFGSIKTKMEAVVTFLALLELLNAHKVKIITSDTSNSFYLSKT